MKNNTGFYEIKETDRSRESYIGPMVSYGTDDGKAMIRFPAGLKISFVGRVV